ncbi:MAG TPA: hypothetical protein VGI39_27255 [Polyangiaceae bacterium]
MSSRSLRLSFALLPLLAPLGCAKLNADLVPDAGPAADADSGNAASAPNDAGDTGETSAPADASPDSEASIPLDASGGQTAPASPDGGDAGPTTGQAPMGAVGWGGSQVEVYAVEAGGEMWHRIFLAGTWGSWEDIGGAVYGPPGLVAWSADAGHVDAFALGTGENLFNKSWYISNSAWNWYPSQTGWLAQGMPDTSYAMVGRPIVLSCADHHEDLFVSVTNGVVWTRSWDGVANIWGDWTSLGGAIEGSVAAVTAEPMTIALFGLGVGRAEIDWRSESNGSWVNTSWASLGAPPAGLAGPPVAVSWGTGRIDLFVLGKDGAVYTRATSDGMTWDPSPSAWTSIGSSPGGAFVGPIAAVAWAPNRIQVFAEGTDQQIYADSFDTSAWGGWRAIGGGAASAPVAVTGGPDKVDLFVVGSDRSIEMKSFDGTTWTPAQGWNPVGGQVAY